MRDGWTRESNNLLFGCAPHDTLNCGHAHADALSFELAVNGRTMLIAPGNYTHTGSKELRDLFRGSRARKTVTFGGEPCPVSDTALLWKTSAGRSRSGTLRIALTMCRESMITLGVLPTEFRSSGVFCFLNGNTSSFETRLGLQHSLFRRRALGKER
jgi:hypothetical protein